MAAALALGSAIARSAPARAATSTHRVVGSLDQPVAFTFGPERTLWYVEKTTGRVRIVDLETHRDSVFFRVSHVNGEAERGVLGIALHPRFRRKPFVYVYATRSTGSALRNQILRIEDVNGSGRHPTVIFSEPASSSPYHNGGRILFGADGMLYAVVGDAHDSANSQDLSRSNDRGKILRMTPNGGIPATNPADARWWAYGIRNSFGFAFDPSTGDLWETDNGPECNDEVNRIREGANYGWGPHETCSGSSPRNTNQDGPNRVLPEFFYRSPIGITGIAFCDGCGLGPASEGTAFFGGVNDGKIRRIVLTSNRRGIRRVEVVATHDGSTLSYEVGRSGGIYFSDFSAIYRLVRR